MKHHDKSKTKESLYLQYYDANSLYACAMTQKWPVVDFKFKKNIQKFTEDFINKTMMKIVVIKDIFLK